MTVSKVLSQWTANDIAYSLRLLLASPPQIFVVAVGPRTGEGADSDVRVSAEPIHRDDVGKWLSMSEASRTAAAEFLLGRALTLEHTEPGDAEPVVQRKQAAE